MSAQPDFIMVSMIFCLAKFLISYLLKLKDNPIKGFGGIYDLVSAIIIFVLAAYLFYYSRKYLPGNLTDERVHNDDPGLEFIRVLIWQMYLISHI